MDAKKSNKFNLDDLKKENPFRVPEHYFDSLGTRIADQIEAKAPKEKIHEPAFAKLKPILVFSGGFAGLVVVFYFGFSLFFSNTSEKGNLANTDIAHLNEYALVSQLDEAVLIEAFSDPEAMDSLVQDNNEHIIDYLVKEDIDISTIIEEL